MSPGVVPITGTGKARFQPLAIDDLREVVVAVLADHATIGREYPLGGPRYWTYREIVEEVLRAMGKRRVLVPMPVPLIRLVAGSAEFVRLRSRSPPTSCASSSSTTSARSTRSSAFGFEPRPMEGGLAHVAKPLAAQEPRPASDPVDADRAGADGPDRLRSAPCMRSGPCVARHRLARRRDADRARRGRDHRREEPPARDLGAARADWTGDQAAEPAIDAATDQLTCWPTRSTASGATARQALTQSSPAT